MLIRVSILWVNVCFELCRFQRAKPVIVDPGLYLSKKSDVFWITQRRSVPTAFKLFTGSNNNFYSFFYWFILQLFLYWIPVNSFYWGCLYVDSPLWFVICHPCVSGSIELDEVSHLVEIIQSLLVYVAFVLIYFSISLKRFVSAMCHGWMPQLLSARMAYFLSHTCVIWFNGVAWSWTSSIIWLHCAYCSCWNCLLYMKTQNCQFDSVLVSE